MTDIVKDKLQEIKNVIEFKWNELKSTLKINDFATLDIVELINKFDKTLEDVVALIEIHLRKFFKLYNTNTKNIKLYEAIFEAIYYLKSLSENLVSYRHLNDENKIPNSWFTENVKRERNIVTKIVIFLRLFRIIHSVFYNNEIEREKNN